MSDHPTIRHWLPPHRDCMHRVRRRCSLSNKNIALDVRDRDDVRCWNRFNCNKCQLPPSKGGGLSKGKPQVD